MGILKDVQEFPRDLKFTWTKAGPGTAVLVAVVFAFRLLIPVGPLIVFAYIAYVSTRGTAPVPSGGKIFLSTAFVCALGLGVLAANLMGWTNDSDNDGQSDDPATDG